MQWSAGKTEGGTGNYRQHFEKHHALKWQNIMTLDDEARGVTGWGTEKTKGPIEAYFPSVSECS